MKKMRIALMGGPGSGKTTLANAFTAFVKNKDVQFYNVPEFARDFIDAHGSAAVMAGYPFIQTFFYEKQREREENVKSFFDENQTANVGLICDSPLMLPWVYAVKYGDNSSLSHVVKADLYEKFLEASKMYTHVFYVTREKRYIEDGTRMQSEMEARDIDAIIKAALTSHRIPHTTISGTLDQRVNKMWETCQESPLAIGLDLV